MQYISDIGVCRVVDRNCVHQRTAGADFYVTDLSQYNARTSCGIMAENWGATLPRRVVETPIHGNAAMQLPNDEQYGVVFGCGIYESHPVENGGWRVSEKYPIPST